MHGHINILKYFCVSDIPREKSVRSLYTGRREFQVSPSLAFDHISFAEGLRTYVKAHLLMTRQSHIDQHKGQTDCRLRYEGNRHP